MLSFVAKSFDGKVPGVIGDKAAAAIEELGKAVGPKVGEGWAKAKKFGSKV